MPIRDRQADDGAVCLGPPSREAPAARHDPRVAQPALHPRGHGYDPAGASLADGHESRSSRVMPPGNSWADATAGAPGIRHCLRGEPDWRTRRRLARLPRAVSSGTWLTTIATKTSRCRGVSSSSTARRSAASRSLHSDSWAGPKLNRSGSRCRSSASSRTPGCRQSAGRSSPTPQR
jgi:hypothetical protein